MPHGDIFKTAANHFEKKDVFQNKHFQLFYVCYIIFFRLQTKQNYIV